MSVLYVMIGLSLIVALIFLAAFLWAVRSGQYDDKFTPSVRMLFDESETRENGKAADRAPKPADAAAMATGQQQSIEEEPEIHVQRSTE